MKTFNISPSDLSFLNSQVSVPIVSIVRYLANGTAIYGYKVPASGFTNPLTGQPFAGNLDPVTGTALPASGSTVELGALGTFDLYHTSWAYFLPPVVSAGGVTAAGVGEPFGLRNVQGLFNNISIPSSGTWGAAYYPFARASAADYSSYSQQNSTNNAFRLRTKANPTDQATVNTLAGLGSGQNPGDSPASAPALWGTLNTTQKALLQDSTYGVIIDPTTHNVDLSQRYANPFLTVYDYAPRMISQTVDSQAALERIDAAAPGTITDTQFYQIADINGGFRTPTYDVNGVDVAGGTYGYDKNGNRVENGTLDSNGVPIENNFFKESYSRNLNTLGGDPSLTGWNTLFGQFFDHGLDFIGKGGNTINGKSSKVYIPLATDDPFYRAPNLLTGDPGYTKLSISRATVDNPDAAGADGMFHTADDIQSPGTDGLYGTADDIMGPTNPNYVNHTSPYIDQSQTYGSNDTVTNLLREWVLDPTTGQYAPGMKLLDGNTLTKAWTQENPDGTFTTTHKTLPTLNELRAYLTATGRDDLSWGDIDNLRVRNSKGNVLTSSGVDGIVGNSDDTAGLPTQFTGHTLIADFLPRLDAAHLLSDPLASVVGHVDVLGGFDSAHIDRGLDTTSAQGAYISDYINLQSGQPTALGNNPANGALLNEILLRSIGDHYVAGDGRVNENFGLTAIHHVWHEDHNWQVDNLITTINQQTAGDRNLWQVTVTAQPSDILGVDVTVVAGHYEKNGNYVTASGAVSWNQEKLFQAAVLVVQTEYQHVAIDQYARGISPNIPLFVSYDSGVNADVTLDYSQVAFRFGHSQLRETIDTLDPRGSLTGAITRYALEQAFLNPEGFAKVGPEAIAQGMSRQISNEIDEIVTPALQQKLLGQPQDLAAINIARGRDLGMPTLNNLRRQLSGGLTAELSDLQQKLNLNPNDATLRETIDKTIALQAGLQAYTSWSDFGNNLLHPDALVNFIAAYAFDGNLAAAELVVKLVNNPGYALTTVEVATLAAADSTRDWANDAAVAAATFVGAGTDANKGFESVDAWNGGLAEKHVFLGELGSTFDAIFADQMTRLINGDRFYYFWRLQLGLPIFTELSSSVSTEQFKDVIERTTGAKHLVGNVFFAADSYVELGEQPANNTSTGAARDHKYGDLVGKLGVGGVYSTFGASEVLNGKVTQIGADKYIIDNRPDIGKNPDGTAAVGFNAHEVIGGTAFKDFIDAGDGDDTIYGDAGNDTLLGNAGADHIYGEAGNDVIYGGALPDFLDGGIGDDEIHGGDDADVLIGAEGNDKIFGENFTDELHGNAGNDYLDGGLDADFIYGGEGQDVVVGGEGLDTTFGEWGDDRMFAGAGPDQLFGGYGDDILNGGAGGQNQNLNVDECLGEFGFNIVSFSDITTPLNTAADLNFQNVNLGSSTPFGQLWVDIQGIEGSGKADVIIGDANDNWLIGGGGNDTLTGGAGDDIIVGDSSLLSTINSLTAANGGAKHFQDLQTTVPNFRFGDTVILGTSGVTYVQQTVLGNDTVIYTGARANFDITLIPDASGIVLKIKDLTLAETGPNGDIVTGIETFKFANVTYALTDIVAPAPSITSISNDTGTSVTDGITNDNTLILTGKAFANSTIEVFRSGIAAPIGSVTANNAGNWSIDYTATSLADGPYTFTAKAAIAGFVSSLSTPFNVTVDTTIATPTLALNLDSGLPGDTITNSGVVNVTGLEAVATWQYSTDGGTTWLTGTGSSFTLTGDGAKSAIVRQTDVAGNFATSATLNFTLDTVVATTTLALALDSGVSALDGITNSGVVNVSGLEAGATWQYSTNNGGAWTTGSGNSFTLTGDGAKSVIVRQTDVAGNVSATSAALNFTLDATAAAAPTLALALDSGLATDKITNSGVVNVTGLEAGTSWQYSTDNGTTWTAGVGSSFTLTGDGAKSAIARQTDVAGNVSATSAALNFTLDTVVAVPTLALNLDSGLSSTDRITNSGVVNVTGLEAGATWQYSTNNGGAWTTGAGSSFTLTGDGAKSVIVRQTDVAGNASGSSAAFTFTLDTLAPTPKTASTTTMTLDTGTSTTDFLTNNGAAGRVYTGTFSTPLVAGNANPANNEGVQVSTDGGITWSTATIVSNTFANRSWTFTDNTVHTSNWTIQTRVVDAAGNGTGAITTRNVTLDTQISAASALTLDLLAATDSGISSTDNYTNNAVSSFAVTFDATKAAVGDVIQIRRGTIVISSTTLNAAQVAAGTFNVTLANTSANTRLAAGLNSLTVNHSDVAGNSVTSATTLDITLDTTAPTAANVGGYTATSLIGSAENSATVQLSTSVSSPLPASFVGTPATASAVNGSFTLDISGLTGSSGGATYYLYQQDLAGNLSPASAQRVVVGTAGADILTGVGGNASDLLVGGNGIDIAQYSVNGGSTALTGQVPSSTGTVNIKALGIDVLSSIETLSFTATGYSGLGNGGNQLRSAVNSTALANNSISEFVGSYDATTGAFTFGASASNNATLVAFDSNSGGGTNYETFLLLGKTTTSGSLGLSGGTVTLSGL